MTAYALVACQNVTAQSNSFSAKIDIGYGFPSGVQYFTNVEGPTKTMVPYSLGAGFNLAAAGNYMFNDNIGTGINFDMLFGTPAVNVDDPVNSINYSITLTGSLFAITPNIIFSAGNDVIKPYTCIGLVIGIPSYTVSTTESGVGSQSGTNIDLYSGNVAVGFYASLGVRFRMTDRIMLDTELFDRDLTYSPGLYTNTQTFDGNPKQASQILSYSTANRTYSSKLSQIVPFGSAGLKAGIIWQFEE